MSTGARESYGSRSRFLGISGSKNSLRLFRFEVVARTRVSRRHLSRIWPQSWSKGLDANEGAMRCATTGRFADPIKK